MKRNIPKILVFTFVTFLVMNVITFNPNLFLIGKWGKLIVALLGILLLEKDFKGFVLFVRKNILIVLFWGLCSFFTLIKILKNNVDTELIQANFLFLFFIYFFYLLSRSFQKTYKNPLYEFFKAFADTLNVNFVFWSLIVLALSLNVWHTLEDRTGLGMFYDSYVQFGIFSCVAALVNFMIVKFTSVKSNKIYFSFFIFYMILVVLTNSRNAQIIVLLAVLLSLLPYMKKVALKYVYAVLTGIVIIGFFYFSNELLLDEDFSEITTGRNWIWFYVLEHYSTNSIFLGEGIFGLNNSILNENITFNYYFQRLDFLYFHSSFIEAFAAAGLIGLVLFILYIFRSLRNKRKLSITMILIPITIGGLFESFLIQPTILTSFLFWYLIVDTDVAGNGRKATNFNSFQ